VWTTERSEAVKLRTQPGYNSFPPLSVPALFQQVAMELPNGVAMGNNTHFIRMSE
jgi:hypothetical protein